MVTRKNAFAIVLLSLIFTIVSVYTEAHAGPASYDPASKTLGGTRPFERDYTLGIISPQDLNKDGDEMLPDGIGVTTRITAINWPAGSSKEAAEALVAADPNALVYYALSQRQETSIAIDVSADTPLGEYTFSIQGVPPTGIGWGLGSHTLELEVAEAVETDDTPPNVWFTAPADNAQFLFCPDGVDVDFAFSAMDLESAISAAGASVNGTNVAINVNGLGTNNIAATGTATVGGVGAYTIAAAATSEGGTGDAFLDFTVNYDITWLPPLSLGKTSKGGSTVPIKFTARDCGGDFVYDESVEVVVYEVTSEGDFSQLSGVFGEGSSAIRIDLQASQYIINFQTRPGTRTYRVDVWFNGFPQATKSFSVR